MSSGKLGSSSYEAGDTGGSCGDYEHGVSQAWVGRMQKRGLKKATKQRKVKHRERLATTAGKANARMAASPTGWGKRKQTTFKTYMNATAAMRRAGAPKSALDRDIPSVEAAASRGFKSRARSLAKKKKR